MKWILSAAGLSGLFFLSSCSAQKATATSGEVSCLLDNSGRQLEWVPVQGDNKPGLLPTAGTATLPTRYWVYRLDQQGLIDYFQRLGASTDTAQLALPLPESPYCLEFTVVPSGTLSAALSQKYPELVSLKGFATGGSRADARIDFDGKQLRAEIRLINKTYLISAWPAEEETVYLLYLKTDSGVEQKPLEPY